MWVPFTDSRTFGLEEGSAAARLAAWNAEVTSGSDDLARRFFAALQLLHLGSQGAHLNETGGFKQESVIVNLHSGGFR